MMNKNIDDFIFKKSKIIIAGGRDYNNILEMAVLIPQYINSLLQEFLILNNIDKEYYNNNSELVSQFKSNIEFVSGCAKGADSIGEQIATTLGYKVVKFPAKWDKYGKSAGFKRNLEMAEYIKDADNPICICFWDEKSKGTNHMIDIAKQYDFIIIINKY